MDDARGARIAQLRHELLELHRAVLAAQRIQYERSHGRIETSGEFLGLVLNHPEFDWIRSLSALIAQMDEWADEGDAASDEELEGIVAAFRALIRPDGENRDFGCRYWKMVEDQPEVTVAHVKVWRLVQDK